MRKVQTMISAIGSTGTARTVQLQGDAVARAEPVAKAASAGAEAAHAAQATPAAEMAAQGAPVDMDKVAAIRARIADGSYHIDARAIADKMIALDLPETR
jgi:negative regulator of flagellin synthesis FlgM